MVERPSDHRRKFFCGALDIRYHSKITYCGHDMTMDDAATCQRWVGPSHLLTFSRTHPNLSSHSHLRMTSRAAINDDCLCSVVLRCTFLQDKRYEELDRTAKYGEDDAGWRNGLDAALAFGECNIPGPCFQYSNLYRLAFLCCVFCKDIARRKPQRPLFESMNV